MHPMLRAIADRQSGLFARQQALACGYTARQFERLTHRKRGPWVRVRYGIYTLRATWGEQSETAKAQLLDRAALLVCDDGTVLSHSSAARALGLPLYDADDGLVHVTRLRHRGRILTGIQAGIKHHAQVLDQCEQITVGNTRCTSPAQTALDVATEFGYRAGLVIADAVLASGVARAELVSLVERTPTSPGHSTRLAVVREADGRAQTPIETLGRILVKGMGIPDVEPQQTFSFPDGSKAFADLYSVALRHVFECDGKLKYQQQVNWRGDRLSADDIVWMEKKREDRLRGQGFGVSRILWADTRAEAFPRVSARIWQEIRAQNAAGIFGPANNMA